MKNNNAQKSVCEICGASLPGYKGGRCVICGKIVCRVHLYLKKEGLICLQCLKSKKVR